MRKLAPIYSTNRMVAEYAERFYLPAAERHRRLACNRALIRSLMDWRSRLHAHANEVRVIEVMVDGGCAKLQVGSKLKVGAKVVLGGLSPADVRLQAYYGQLTPEGRIASGTCTDLTLKSSAGVEHLYEGEVDCVDSGSCGVSVRVVPFQQDALVPYENPWVQWAE